jgi:hypothetical protein
VFVGYAQQANFHDAIIEQFAQGQNRSCFGFPKNLLPRLWNYKALLQICFDFLKIFLMHVATIID